MIEPWMFWTYYAVGLSFIIAYQMLNGPITITGLIVAAILAVASPIVAIVYLFEVEDS